MLTRIARTVVSKRRINVGSTKTRFSGLQSVVVRTKIPAWRSKSIIRHASFTPESLQAAGVPDKPESINLAELAATAQMKPPTEEDLLKMARAYQESTGKPIMEPPAYSDNPQTLKFNSILKSCLRAFEYNIMGTHFLIALKDRVLPDNESFALAIEGAVRAKRPELIESYEKLISMLTLRKTLPTFNALLFMCAEFRNDGKADSVWQEMKTTYVKPDIRSLDYYLQAHASPEHLKKSVEIFSKWPEKYELKPDAGFQSTFIKVLLAADKEDMAMKRYQSMVDKKLPSPNNYTFQVLMDHHLKKGEFFKIQEVYDSIHSKFGLYPDKDNNLVLLEMKIKRNDYDSALKLVWDFCKERYPISARIMTELMMHYGNNNDLYTVEKLWGLLPSAKVKPDIDMVTTLVSTCLALDKPDRAMAYTILAKEKFNVPPNRFIYAAMMKSYGVQQNLEKVISIYRRMIFTDKIMPGPSTFVSLIHAYAANGRADLILPMLKNPSNHGIPRMNRHFFEDAIYALEMNEPNPLATLETFDWARLQNTVESPEELKILTQSIMKPTSPTNTHIE